MKVKVKNRKKRTFSAEIPSRPTGVRSVVRMNHNPQTGEVRPKIEEVTLYETVRILPGETVELDEEILDGPGFQSAIKKDKWLRILR